MHDGGKVIRINGIYQGNQGGNIADIGSGTQSIILNSTVHDSTTLIENENANITAYGGARMWVFDCLSYGSEYDLRVDVNGIIYSRNNRLEVGRNYNNGGEIIPV